MPPADSRLFDPTQFSGIQDKVKSTDNNTKVVILGDMNTRFGTSVRDIPASMELRDAAQYMYPRVPDPVSAPNVNAVTMATICSQEALVVVNNLKTPTRHFPSKQTFRKVTRWISELDSCIVSHDLVNYVQSFEVFQDQFFPSDHAPITLSVQPPLIDVMSLLSRAHLLGDHAVLHSVHEMRQVKRPVKEENVNFERFLDVLSRDDVPEPNGDVNSYADGVVDILYECADVCKCDRRRPGGDPALERWDRLLNDPDDARIWRAIDWKGEYVGVNDSNGRPTDQEFKTFYEELLSPPNSISIDECHTHTYIPVLDDDISVDEVQCQVRRLKASRASGPDGVCPAVFKVLPIQWILSITNLFNMVFASGSYTAAWCNARLVSIFKRGDKSVASNYRGINIINCIAKLYDMVLCERLKQWFTPYREQAGSQYGRGYLEHIVSFVF